MIRVVACLLVVCGVVAFAFTRGGGSGGEAAANRYTVELDNAFGLSDGADVKVAGVRAGRITGFEIDEKSYRALVEIEIDQQGFGDLRADAFCESRPQSLIGEYFLDCRPGESERKLPAGGRVPVEQTGSTIPVDLVNNIMRRPYRERFSIILGELGAALAARGDDLDETIRRANPALRETNKVLATLADQRLVIRDLTTDAERVVGALAGRRTEVTRFIAEARDTARVSATRAQDIRGQLQRLPVFLRELRPTMAALGEAADRQTPALTNLSRQADLLERLFDRLGPFSDASRPALRTLADASVAGRSAVRAATPRVTELRALAVFLPEVARNLAVTLEHLDDRRFAVEKDPRSPGGQGFTGLEAFLSYIFRQSQATNVYDGNSYLLKVSAFLDNLCAQYTDAEQAKDPARKRCDTSLGPNRPGITSPDPTKGGATADRTTTARDREPAPDVAPEPGGSQPAPEPSPGKGPLGDIEDLLPDLPLPDPSEPLPPEVQQLLEELGLAAPTAPGVPGGPGVSAGGQPGGDPTGVLLDYLLG